MVAFQLPKSSSNGRFRLKLSGWGVYTGYRIRRFLSFFTAKGLRFYHPFEGLQGYTGIHVGIVFFKFQDLDGSVYVPHISGGGILILGL